MIFTKNFFFFLVLDGHKEPKNDPHNETSYGPKDLEVLVDQN